MQRRFVFIRFCYLLTDWTIRRRPELGGKALVLAASRGGQRVIAAVNALAESTGVYNEMPLADARALAPQLTVLDFDETRARKILAAMAEWCIRYTPLVTIDPARGLWLDMTGGAHLFGGETSLIGDINLKFKSLGYQVRVAAADTAGGAWALAYHARTGPIAAPGSLRRRLAPLPVECLRLRDGEAGRLASLGLRKVEHIINLPRGPLSRRLGKHVLLRLDQALGMAEEALTPFRIPPVLEARAHAPDGVMVQSGLIVTLKRLIDQLCEKLAEGGNGLREGRFQVFRFDGQVETVGISTSGPSKSSKHLFKLFEEKALKINLGFGAESFVLSALHIEPVSGAQDGLQGLGMAEDTSHLLPELVDRLRQKLGDAHIYRFHPYESHLPERAAQRAAPLAALTGAAWPLDRARPVLLLPHPAPIEVVAPVPDYPPMMFRYKGSLHRIRHAEGPERIEAEWWRRKSELRDYYRLEDENGKRYWIFRLGHYRHQAPSRWFLHGFFG